ncbi:MAG TPA: hypothetical protein VFB26_09265, partial [Gaiellaceae bacterium]|nr:hypothetical protein [Gaiellaceae bacterium]
MSSASLAAALASLLYPGGQPSWEQPELTSLGTLPPRATLLPFETPEAAATLDRRRACLLSLDGTWRFRLVDRPAQAPGAAGRAERWQDVEVPGLWTMLGYESPHYTNVAMPFAEQPPRVPERNPTGLYRRRFQLPRSWRGRRIVLHFGGVEGVLHVLVNGRPVGLAKDARTPAEFDVSDLVLPPGQTNEVLAAVVRWSDASFVEDQDQWWHAGIAREVCLYATRPTYIADVFARGDLDDRYRDGVLTVTAQVAGPEADSAALRAQLLDPRGQVVLAGRLEPSAAGHVLSERVRRPRL